MKRERTRKAMIAAMMPALLIPAMICLHQSRVPDELTGLIAGIVIGCMILLLISAARDRRHADDDNAYSRASLDQ